MHSEHAILKGRLSTRRNHLKAMSSTRSALHACDRSACPLVVGHAMPGHDFVRVCKIVGTGQWGFGHGDIQEAMFTSINGLVQLPCGDVSRTRARGHDTHGETGRQCQQALPC